MRVEKLVYRGDGLGHDDGKAVFIPMTAPGDVVIWRPLREKKRYVRGRIERVVSPSPDRVAPVCPLFGRCGGCQWQHIAYGAQRRWKGEILREILERDAGVPRGKIAPLLPSPAPYGYRSRARLAWGREGVGFRRAESRRVVPVSRCALLVPALNDLLETVRKGLESFSLDDFGGEVLLEAGDGGSPRAVFRFRHVSPEAKKRVEAGLKEVGALLKRRGFSLWADVPGEAFPVRISGEGALFLEPVEGRPIRLAVPPGGFFQANLGQNRVLGGIVLAAVAAASSTSRSPRVLDLYCGMGNFSIPVAARGGEVTGVDSEGPSIESARRSAAANGVPRARFVRAGAADFLGEMIESGAFPYDVCILDPPRAGAKEAAALLTEPAARPGAVVYVSCDPMTLARDLKILTTSAYEVVSVTPVDLFPQTFHIETVTVLRRR